MDTIPIVDPKKYEFEIVIKRKKDGHGARIGVVPEEVFNITFLSQLMYSIGKNETK